MSAAYRIVYTVAPKQGYERRHFPIDMLRYDGAFPRTEADANRIADSYHAVAVIEPIELVQVRAEKHAAVGEPRWESFGWRVVQVSKPEKI